MVRVLPRNGRPNPVTPRLLIRVKTRNDGARMTPRDFLERLFKNDIAAVKVAILSDPSLVEVRDTLLGSTPLIFAAHRGFLEIVEALLDADADVHARETVSGTTALHWAAEAGLRNVATLLVAHGAELEARDEWFGLTPLGWATVVTWAPDRHNDRPNTAADLLAAGAHHDIFTAIASDASSVIRELVSADPAVLQQRLGFVGDEQTPLHIAVTLRRPDMVRLLIELGADKQATTSDGQTPQDLAQDQPELAELLAAPSRGGPDPSKLLFHAAKYDRAELVPQLLRSGADPHLRTRRLVGESPAEITPLHVAAQRGHTATLAALLEAGADVRGGADPGVPTPLHVAAGAGDLDAIKLLLSRGADPHDRDRQFNATPLGWAEWSQQQDVVAYLRDHADNNNN